MTAHAWWRLRGLLQQAAGNGSLAFATVEMRATIGGADQCTGGTASAGSTFSTFVAANAFDGNPATVWSSDNAAGLAAQWIAYHFAAPVSVAEVYVLTHSSLNGMMISQVVESSDDGVTWTPEWTHTRMADWVISEARAFRRPVFAATHLSWRVLCLDAQDGGAYSGFAEVEFRATPGGADQTTGGTPIADSNFDGTTVAANAYDNAAGTAWASAAGMPHYIGYTFAAPVAVEEVSLTTRNDAVAYAQAPRTLIIQSAADAKTWVDERTHAGVAWTGPLQQRLIPALGNSLTTTKYVAYAATGVPPAALSTPKLLAYATMGAADLSTPKYMAYAALGPADLSTPKYIAYAVTGPVRRPVGPQIY